MWGRTVWFAEGGKLFLLPINSRLKITHILYPTDSNDIQTQQSLKANHIICSHKTSLQENQLLGYIKLFKKLKINYYINNGKKK